MNYHPQSYTGDSPISGFDAARSRKAPMRSSDVVKEAKEWSQWKARSTAMTKRPYTPRDYDRRLFGQTGSPSSSRPPSAISISSRIFDPTDPESRPGSAAPVPAKLSPLPQAPVVPENAEPVPPKFPVPPSLNKQDLSKRPPAKARFSRKINQGPNSPMKAFQMDGVGANSSQKIIDAKPVKPEFENVTTPRDSSRPSSKTRLNINLANLYGSEDKSNELPEKKTSASSSSSSSGSYAETQSARSQNKSSGSISGGTEETPDQAKYWNQNILPLMELLEDSSRGQDGVYDTCKELYRTLLRGDCLKNLLGRRRTSLLSTLFKLLNGSTSSTHLICAKIILDLRVRRQNLNSLCKMLYKISREKKHDAEYVEHDLIASMLTVIDAMSDPLENYETLVYLTGTVKFLSDNQAVANDLIDKNCPKCFITLMREVMSSLKERNYSKKEKLHATDILIQITAVLRAISDIDRKRFIGVDMFDLLIEALHVLANDESLTLNISRIISKFTMFDEVIPELMGNRKWAAAILNAAAIHRQCLNIVIRLFFALGNLTSKDEDARLALHKTVLRPSSAAKSANFPQNYLSLTNSVLDIFIKPLSKPVDSDKDQTDRAKCLDTINKIIRVVANIAISESPGIAITSNTNCIGNIVKILTVTTPAESEELVINTLTALNNLSYYNVDDNAISQKRIQIANVLIKVLMDESMPCTMEAVRVFGNISRYEEIPSLLHANQIDLMMVTLLDSKTWQMVYSACGVLINVSTKQGNRKGLLKEGVVAKLVDVLKHFVPAEWHVCGVACQLLWNLCDDGVLSSTDADTILQVLHTYLMDDAPALLIDASDYDDDFIHYIIDSWKSDFVPVATRLYNKISSQHSQLQPL